MRKIRNINYEKSVVRIKNPTSQDESGVLFQINHVDPPLRAKGAQLIGCIIQGKLRDVNKKEDSLLPRNSSPHRR